MRTPYECLERLAAGVAPHVPGKDSIVHVNVEFDRQPFEVKFSCTPYDRGRRYELSMQSLVAAPGIV